MTNTQHGIECESGRLASATYGRFETRYPVRRFYDDGDGPVWIYQDAGGLLGIVRARSWENAWSIVGDEILDDANEAGIAEHFAEAYAAKRAQYPGQTDEQINAHDAPDLPEGCGYRNNGNGSNPWNQTAIYQEDLNGSQLRLLTYDDMAELGIRLTWETWDHKDSAE